MTCNACGKVVEPPYLRIEFVGKPGSKLTGSSFVTCAGCISLNIPDRHVPLPERVSDPVAEPQTVSVERDPLGGWDAICHECRDVVAFSKDDEDDAHLAAARHLARVHAGVAA